MKINEVIVKELSPDPDKPSKGRDDANSADRFGGRGSQQNTWTQAELDNVRQVYSADPKYIKIVQNALLKPNITTMAQALAYASAVTLNDEPKDQPNMGGNIKGPAPTDYDSDKAQRYGRERQDFRSMDQTSRTGGDTTDNPSLLDPLEWIPGIKTARQKIGNAIDAMKGNSKQTARSFRN